MQLAIGSSIKMTSQRGCEVVIPMGQNQGAALSYQVADNVGVAQATIEIDLFLDLKHSSFVLPDPALHSCFAEAELFNRHQLPGVVVKPQVYLHKYIGSMKGHYGCI